MKIAARINKSLLTNMIAAGCAGLGVFGPETLRPYALSVGVFALSGALTNWLAVHMLFERVPGLYGSGVIPNRFEELKAAIKHLVMTQFFSDEQVDRFFHPGDGDEKPLVNLEPIVDEIDYDQLFDRFMSGLARKGLSPLMTMLGETAAMNPLRDKFKKHMRSTLVELTRQEAFLEKLEQHLLPSHLSGEVRGKIEVMIDRRLDEMTPEMVKVLLQDLMRNHLGWLVVWGGVFGGLIGLLMALVQTI